MEIIGGERNIKNPQPKTQKPRKRQTVSEESGHKTIRVLYAVLQLVLPSRDVRRNARKRLRNAGLEPAAARNSEQELCAHAVTATGN